jgi:hypothetical protein
MAEKFFDTHEVGVLIDRARHTLENIVWPDRSKFDFLVRALGIIRANAAEFDEHSQVNIRMIGPGVTGTLDKVGRTQPVQDADVDQLYAMLYRFLVEFDLSSVNGLSDDLSAFQRFAETNLALFSAPAQYMINFSVRQMPIVIMKHLLGTEALQNVQNVKRYAESVDAKIAAFTNDLKEREKRVSDLKDSLETYKSAFNFVGLYDGFDDLAQAKGAEVEKQRKWLVVFGLLAVTPLLVGMTIFYLNIDHLSNIGWPAVWGVIPAVSLTVILIYFFRVALRASDAAKAQLLQLNLRKTLCRFIQSYADYAKSVGETNPAALGKFENVIFAGLVSSEEKLPATFDGVDQLSNFIKAVRSPT